MTAVITAINWAAEEGWLPAVPKIPKVKIAKLKKMKGRPICLEEFDRILSATATIVGEDAVESWGYLLLGLWESGFRLDELLHVSWDDPDCIMPIWPRGGLPMLSIPAAMQKKTIRRKTCRSCQDSNRC